MRTRWLVTNSALIYGRHRLFVWLGLGERYYWAVEVSADIGGYIVRGDASDLHGARVAAKRASARIQGKRYAGVGK